MGAGRRVTLAASLVTGYSFVDLPDERKGDLAVVGWIRQQPGPARRVSRWPARCGATVPARAGTAATVVVESLVVVRWLRHAWQIQSPRSCPLLPVSGARRPTRGRTVVGWHLGRSRALPLTGCRVEVRIILASCGGTGKRLVFERKESRPVIEWQGQGLAGTGTHEKYPPAPPPPP